MNICEINDAFFISLSSVFLYAVSVLKFESSSLHLYKIYNGIQKGNIVSLYYYCVCVCVWTRDNIFFIIYLCAYGWFIPKFSRKQTVPSGIRKTFQVCWKIQQSILLNVVIFSWRDLINKTIDIQRRKITLMLQYKSPRFVFSYMENSQILLNKILSGKKTVFHSKT